jgi:hypothetical protein
MMNIFLRKITKGFIIGWKENKKLVRHENNFFSSIFFYLRESLNFDSQRTYHKVRFRGQSFKEYTDFDIHFFSR